MELAVSWELAARTDRGLPSEVADVLDRHESTRDAVLLFAVPEHRVALPGGRRASQTDLWAVVKVAGGWASVAIEGKAGEPFGPTVSEWLQDASAGKRARLDSLCETLRVEPTVIGDLRYQLFHRAASAILEAARIGAGAAVLVVQNFRPATNGWADFETFVAQFGAVACRGGVCESSRVSEHRLLFAWVDSPVASDAQLALAV